MPGEADLRVEPFRPPPVDALSRSEREELRSCLLEAVTRWDGAAETGLRLEGLTEAERSEVADPLPVPGDAIEYAAADAGLALRLSPALCGELVCLGLGVAPDGAERALTATDLAIVDIWALHALRELSRTLGHDAVRTVTRTRGAVTRLLADDAIVAAGLAWGPDAEEAGLVAIQRGSVRERGEGERRTLSDDPEALMGATVRLGAIIDGPSLPVSELIEIEEGDVLLLGGKADARAALVVDGAEVATGRPGAKSRRRALRLRDQAKSRQVEKIDDWGAEDGI